MSANGNLNSPYHTWQAIPQNNAGPFLSIAADGQSAEWTTAVSVSGQFIIKSVEYDKKGGWSVGLFPKHNKPYESKNFLGIIYVPWTWRPVPNAFVRWMIKTVSFGNIIVLKEKIRRNN